jgi:hypothetical protein
MPAASYNIKAEQGSSWNLYLEYQTSGGTAIDLSSYSARMQVRPSATSSNIILDLTGSTASAALTGGKPSIGYYTSAGITGQTGTGGITLNASTTGVVGTTGGIYLSVDADAMSNALSGEHRYDFELVDGTTVTRLVEGEFKIQSEITK